MNTKSTPKNKMTGFAMRGSVDISDIDKYPNSKYWAMGARGALKRIRILSGCQHEDKCRIDDLIGKFWRDKNTWMEICLKTEHFRDLILALKKGE